MPDTLARQQARAQIRQHWKSWCRSHAKVYGERVADVKRAHPFAAWVRAA